MRRTSVTLDIVNLFTAMHARGRHDPDKAFDKIVDKVRSDIDGVTLRESDEALLDSIRQLMRFTTGTEGLSGVGWLSIIDMITARVDNLFRVRKLHDLHPEIGREAVRAPIFVVGMPRTATTLTHKVLAQSPGNRGPLLWEMYNVDLPQPVSTQKRHRDATQRRIDQTLALSPSWKQIHPVSADLPEEIYFLLIHTALHCSVLPMPDYVEFLKTHDSTADYQFIKECLQVLQHGREPKRWALKHPGSLFHLQAVHKVFPDAKVVWTHRDPNTVMGSMCSMAESLIRLHVKRRSVDLHAIGELWLKILSEGVTSARDQRASLPRTLVTDVGYHLLMSDPFAYVPHLFEQLDIPWTDVDERNLKIALDRPTDHRGHEYAMSYYGLTPEAIGDAFGDYERFVTMLRLTTATQKAGNQAVPGLLRMNANVRSRRRSSRLLRRLGELRNPLFRDTENRRNIAAGHPCVLEQLHGLTVDVRGSRLELRRLRRVRPGVGDTGVDFRGDVPNDGDGCGISLGNAEAVEVVTDHFLGGAGGGRLGDADAGNIELPQAVHSRCGYGVVLHRSHPSSRHSRCRMMLAHVPGVISRCRGSAVACASQGHFQISWPPRLAVPRGEHPALSRAVTTSRRLIGAAIIIMR